MQDVFASERRKAKTLNFSIAYGKTAFGLAKDWGVSFGGGVDGGGVCDCYAEDDVDGIGQVTKEQAQDILELWYRDRPEVRRWQERVKAEAMEGELSEVSVAIMCCSRIIAHHVLLTHHRTLFVTQLAGVHADGPHALPAWYQGEQVLKGFRRRIAHGCQHAHSRCVSASARIQVPPASRIVTQAFRRRC